MLRVAGTRRCNDDFAGAVKIAVLRRVVFFALVEGEEDLSDFPFALDFGWVVLCSASYASAAFAVENDIR